MNKSDPSNFLYFDNLVIFNECIYYVIFKNYEKKRPVAFRRSNSPPPLFKSYPTPMARFRPIDSRLDSRYSRYPDTRELKERLGPNSGPVIGKYSNFILMTALFNISN